MYIRSDSPGIIARTVHRFFELKRKSAPAQQTFIVKDDN